LNTSSVIGCTFSAFTYPFPLPFVPASSLDLRRDQRPASHYYEEQTISPTTWAASHFDCQSLAAYGLRLVVTPSDCSAWLGIAHYGVSPN